MTRHRRSSRRLLSGALTTLFVVLIGCTPTPQFVGEFAPEAPLALIGVAPYRIGHPALVLSPNGDVLVYVGGGEGETRLYRRGTASSDATPIPGTEGAYGPFFSSDGKRVGFFAGDRLKHVSLEGGDVVDLVLVHNAFGGAWRDDDTILYADHECARLQGIPASGGPTTEVLSDGGCWPHLLPGGRTALVATWHSLEAVDLDSGSRRVLLAEDFAAFGTPRYVSSGHILYANRGRLMAVAFDAEQLALTGAPVVVAGDMRTEALDIGAHFVVTQEGDLFYIPGSPADYGRFVWVDEQGREEPVAIPEGLFGEYRLDQTGTRLAAPHFDGRWLLYVYDLGTGSAVPLATDGQNYSPAWTPDGASILFRSQRDATWDLFLASADGTADPELIRAGGGAPQGGWITPDGSTLLTAEFSESTLGDVVALPLHGDGDPVVLVQGPAVEWGPATSPDGELLAYMSDEFGRYEVMVRHMAGGESIRVSQDGGMDPIWSADGRTLYFHTVARGMAAAIELEPELKAAAPEILFEGPYVDIGGFGWARAADGRFLMVRETQDSSAPVALRRIPDWASTLNE